MNPFFTYLTQRLAEPSTWAGIAIVAQGAAHGVATHDWLSIIQAVGGAIAIVAPERGQAAKP